MKKRMVVAATAAAVVGLSVGVGSASASEYLYWPSGLQSPSIARAAVDGTGVNTSFIPRPSQSNPVGIAVTPDNLYWMEGSNGRTLIRGNLDGSGSPSTVRVLSQTGNFEQFAIQEAQVYFPGVSGKLGRVGIDGSSFNDAFSPTAVFQGGPFFSQVVADATHAYVVEPNDSGIASVRLSDGIVDNASLISGVSPTMRAVAMSDGYIYWSTSSGIGRAKADGTDVRPAFISGLSQAASGIAVGGGYIYWGSGSFPGPYAIGRAKADGTQADSNFITGVPTLVQSLAVTQGGGAPAPAPTPTPTPGPAPTATTLATPTVNTSAPGRNAVVTVRTQLGAKGKYTFIFERPSANEMSREQATSSRVAMQKGTRIGKRTLKKRYTAAVITTTADNAKVVTRALLRKAQARKLNLRVVYAPTGTAQSGSVIKIK